MQHALIQARSYNYQVPFLLFLFLILPTPAVQCINTKQHLPHHSVVQEQTERDVLVHQTEIPCTENTS